MNRVLNYRKLFAISAILFALCCKNNNHSGPTRAQVDLLHLKRGEVISCGPPTETLGTADFHMSCTSSASRFNQAIELLHSFEYDEAEKAFAAILDEDPNCAMAFWGVAMCNFHALWTAPTKIELEKGSKAIELAQMIDKKTPREAEYINAIAAFYNGWKNSDHLTRCIRYEKAMAKLHTDYPEDKEAAIFYALSLDASANPSDKTFANQKKAGAILHALYPSTPNHPGIIHYIIHTYDYPGLASLALPAAREYAKVAPSSAHALHMPSHIFTRLGLWDECIHSNRLSLASAKCYADQAHLRGHWDEELHAMDYLVYAFLQKGQNQLAEEQLHDLLLIREVYPINFKVAYAFAAIPARICLENKDWQRAAALQIYPSDLPWHDYPWQESIYHFAKLMGAARLKNLSLAHAELDTLQQRWATLSQQKDIYKARQVQVQIQTGKAWIDFASGRKEQAIREMMLAARIGDSTEKHPVTPGEVLPARELLGDMLMEQRMYTTALEAYEAVLQRSPNRFNSLFGAADAAQKANDRVKALFYYRQLLSIADTATSKRKELAIARSFVQQRAGN